MISSWKRENRGWDVAHKDVLRTLIHFWRHWKERGEMKEPERWQTVLKQEEICQTASSRQGETTHGKDKKDTQSAYRASRWARPCTAGERSTLLNPPCCRTQAALGGWIQQRRSPEPGRGEEIKKGRKTVRTTKRAFEMIQGRRSRHSSRSTWVMPWLRCPRLWAFYKKRTFINFYCSPARMQYSLGLVHHSV